MYARNCPVRKPEVVGRTYHEEVTTGMPATEDRGSCADPGTDWHLPPAPHRRDARRSRTSLAAGAGDAVHHDLDLVPAGICYQDAFCSVDWDEIRRVLANLVGSKQTMPEQ